MIFNFTTRLQSNNVNVELVDDANLLGTHISNDLKWDRNTQGLVKKANARLHLLRRITSFKAPMKDLKLVHITFI